MRLVAVAALAAAALACDRPIALAEGAIVQIDFDVPADVQALPKADHVVVTAEVQGLAAETRLLFDGKHAHGSLGFAVKDKIAAPVVLRIYGNVEGGDPAVLAVATAPLEVAAGVELFVGDGAQAQPVFVVAPTGDADGFLDKNRNGRPNLVDIESGCDPSIPPPFVRVSATDVQFSGADRQVVVVDNLVQRSITVRADVIDAAGVGVSVLEAGAEEAASLPTTDDVSVPAGGSLLLAVSFTPANPFLATGFLAIEAIDDVAGGAADPSRCGTRTAVPVRIIANVDGGPKAADPSALPPSVPADADLGGDVAPADVVAFPLESAASGAAVGVELLRAPPSPRKKLGGAFADAVFLVQVPRGGRLATSLSGVPFDADLHLWKLEDDATVGAELPRRPPALDDDGAGAPDGQTAAAPLPGGAVEAGDVVADAFLDDGASALNVLITVAASGAGDGGALDVDSGTATTGAPAARVQAQLVAHVITAPRLTQRPSPAQASVSGGAVVTLRGNGLRGGGRVLFGGVPAACDDVVDDGAGRQHVACAAPQGTLAFGRNPVDVLYEAPRAPGATFAETGALVQGFLYVPDAPVVSAIEPNRVSTAGGALVTIRGAGFTDRYGPIAVRLKDESGAVVAAGGVGLVDDNTLVASLPPHAEGLVDVVVAVRAQDLVDELSGTLAGGLLFAGDVAPPPQVTSVSPPVGPVAGGGQITLFGSGFQSGVVVTFGGAAAQVLVAGGGAVVVAPPAHGEGSVDVVVTNPDGQGATVEGAFTYVAAPVPPPDLFAITPAAADVAGGAAVTLLGGAFQPGAVVRFGTSGGTPSQNGASGAPAPGGAAALVTATGSGAIAVVVPAHAAGIVDVTVDNPDGQHDTLPNAFTYSAGGGGVLAPTVLDVAPDPAHAVVAFEELTVLGDDLETTLAACVLDASVVDVAAPGVHCASAGAGVFAATITSQSTSLVSLVVDDALPASAQLVVELVAADGGAARSPAFAAQAPTPLSISARGRAEEGAPFTLVVDGFALDASHLVSFHAEPLDAQSGAAVDLPVTFAAETIASADVAAGTLGRGGWTIALVYDDGTSIDVDVVEVGGVCPGSALCALCGDGLRDPGEQCDGQDFGGVTCTSLGFTGGALTCAGCRLDAATCSVCGNGAVEGTEQCDGANLGGATCAALGFTTGTPSCSSSCQLSAATCARCGDGVCSQSESNASCAADCPASCGDDTCNGGETCSSCPRDCSLCAPYHFVVVSGGLPAQPTQHAPITGFLGSEMRVRVVDEGGAPVPNVPVAFAPPAGDVTTFSVVVTNAAGEAGVGWVVGPRVGAHTLVISATPPDGTPVAESPLQIDAVADDVAAGTIITLAGDNQTAGATTFGQNGAGLRSHLNGPRGVAVDRNGDVVIALTTGCEVLKLHMPDGALERILGTSRACSAINVASEGDGLVSTDARVKMRSPDTVAMGPDGAIYVTDELGTSVSDVVRRIDGQTGVVTTVAGGGPNSAQSDGMPATQAFIQDIDGIAFAFDGDLVITDTATNSYRRVDLGGSTCDVDDDCTAPARCAHGDFDDDQSVDALGRCMIASGASISSFQPPAPYRTINGQSSNTLSDVSGPMILAGDPPNDLFIVSMATNTTNFGAETFAVCDAAAGCLAVGANIPSIAHSGVTRARGSFFAGAIGALRRMDGINGVTLLAGNGTQGFSGDRGPGTSALVGVVAAVAVRGSDVVFVDDRNTLRMVRGAVPAQNDVVISATSGDGQSVDILQQTQSNLVINVAVNGVPAVTTNAVLRTPVGGAALATSLVTDVFGNTGTQVSAPRFVDVAGTTRVALYQATLASPLDRLVPASASFTVTVAQPLAGVTDSTFTSTGTALPAPTSRLRAVLSNAGNASNHGLVGDILFDPDGDGFLVSMNGDARVLHVDATGIATPFAGTGVFTTSGDGGFAVSASINNPGGLARDAAGNVYIAEASSHRIRRVDTLGSIVTFAGTGSSGTAGDGGPATSATLLVPSNIVAGADDLLYLIDNARLRAIDLVNGSHDIQFISRFDNFSCNAATIGTAAGINFPTASAALGSSPDGRVFFANRVSGNASCPFTNGLKIFELEDGDFKRVGGVLVPPIVEEPSAGAIEAIAMRGDGVLFYVVLNAGTRTLRARLTDGSLVTVAGAPNADDIAVGPNDGLLYLLDDQIDQLHLFQPPL